MEAVGNASAGSSRPSGWERIETLLETVAMFQASVAPGLRAGRGLKLYISVAQGGK